MAVKLIEASVAEVLYNSCTELLDKLDTTDKTLEELTSMVIEAKTKLSEAVGEYRSHFGTASATAKLVREIDSSDGHELYGVPVTVTPKDENAEAPAPSAAAKVPLKFKKLVPEAKLPAYAHEGDAGMDVFALEDTNIHLDHPTLVKTGLAAEIPPGYEIQVRPRSGLALKGVTVWNSPGTIDSKYRGEIGIILMFNNNELESIPDDTGRFEHHVPKRFYEIKKGDKIAQLVLAPVTFADVSETEELSETDRGTGGFGSTGR